MTRLQATTDASSTPGLSKRKASSDLIAPTNRRPTPSSPLMAYSRSIVSRVNTLPDITRDESFHAPFVNSKMACEASKIRPFLTGADIYQKKQCIVKAIAHNSKSGFRKLPIEVQRSIVQQSIRKGSLEDMARLLEVDGTVFFPAVYQCLYHEQVFLVEVYPDGIQFGNQPCIERLEYADQLEPKTFFTTDDSPFRIACVRKIKVNIWAPSHLDQDLGAEEFGRMLNNLSYLVDQLTSTTEECTGPFKSDASSNLVMLHIEFKERPKPKPRNTNNALQASLAGVVLPEQATPDQTLPAQSLNPAPQPAVGIGPQATVATRPGEENHSTFWVDHDDRKVDPFPRRTTISEIANIFRQQITGDTISNIELVLLPFARLRGVNTQKIEFPPILVDDPTVAVMSSTLREEMSSNEGVSKSALGLEGHICERLEVMLYHMSIDRDWSNSSLGSRSETATSDIVYPDWQDEDNEEEIMMQLEDDSEEETSTDEFQDQVDKDRGAKD